jgi:hypothetical protein
MQDEIPTGACQLSPSGPSVLSSIWTALFPLFCVVIAIVFLPLLDLPYVLLVDARVLRWSWILAIIHSFFLPFLRTFF